MFFIDVGLLINLLMCFSANASFGSAVLLISFGIATTRKITSVNQIPISLIPFLFAIQQICEGFLWLSFRNEFYADCRNLYVYVYLFFAHFLWPIIIPFSFKQLEQNVAKKRIISLLFFIGLLVSFLYLFAMFYFPVSANIIDKHIRYKLDYPSWLLILGSWVYGFATVLPTFISSFKKAWILGLLIAGSYLFTYFFYREFIISVWCYFSAVISIVIYWIIKMNKLQI